MPDEDNNFGGSLAWDFRKLWRHVQPKILWVAGDVKELTRLS